MNFAQFLASCAPKRNSRPVGQYALNGFWRACVSAFAIIIAHPSFGFLGATEQQCRLEYQGEVIERGYHMEPGDASKTVAWKSDEWVIEASFVDEKAVHMMYRRKNGELRNEDVKRWLEASAEGSGWKEVAGPSGQRIFLRIDKAAFCSVILRTDSMAISRVSWMEKNRLRK